jgi:2-succinyl-5-enolpyruvyl-6-hydroxy-3-cyclohexene-1-carboxylate synthase
VSAADNRDLAGRLCLHMASAGVQHAVCSPGSRNTPLLLALHALSGRTNEAGAPAMELHVVLDERVAGFVALGLARATGAPVLLCCTSGSAGAHWLPAVVEASASGVPLVLVTADRPPELHGVGAPQTMPQVGLFGSHCRAAEDLGPPHGADDPRWVRNAVERLLCAATGRIGVPGPVHLNVRFRKPLWEEGLPALPAVDPHELLRLDPAPVTVADPAQVQSLLEWAAGGEAGLVVCGHRDAIEQGQDDPLPAAALAFAAGLGWPLVVEASSGLRFAAGTAPSVVTTGDALVRGGRAPRPDRVLRLGCTATNRGLQEWLDGLSNPNTSLLVDPHGLRFDPAGGARLVRADPAALLAAASASLAGGAGPWAERWAAADADARAIVDAAAADGFWAATVVRAALASLPAGAWLHVASSMPIRDLDSYGQAARDLRVSANRGVNGIDGTLSTGLGLALGASSPTLVLLGDLAFLHDSGGLLQAVATQQPLTALVVDNRGGGIFAHLPIRRHPSFEELFLTPQPADPLRVALGAGARAVEVHSADALQAALSEAVSRPGLDVVVARIDRDDDLQRHQQAWAAAAAVWG